jgi:hypothetical protein
MSIDRKKIPKWFETYFERNLLSERRAPKLAVFYMRGFAEEIMKIAWLAYCKGERANADR